jgi:DNA end-binding protein Ku
MLKEKQAGIKPPKGKPAERPRNVINLFDALKRSVSAETGKTAPRAKRGKKRVEGQREMLLPISGKKGKDAAASTKAPARSHGKQRKAG